MVRTLFRAIAAHTGPALVDDVVLPWRTAEGASTWRQIEWLGRPEAAERRVGDEADTPDGGPWGELTLANLLTQLYALSRISDLLVAPYQRPRALPGDETEWWTGPVPERGSYEAVFGALGLSATARRSFHPFFHEIVTVDEAKDRSAPPELIEELWPGYMLGNLLIARAGVRIRAGADVIDRFIAETSTLYWAWWRRSRPTHDYSHSWGHNSQWNTDFRRDYVLGGRLELNVDGGVAPGARGHDLNRLERRRGDHPAVRRRIELVTNRCVLQPPDLPDGWLERPFDDRYTMALPAT